MILWRWDEMAFGVIFVVIGIFISVGRMFAFLYADGIDIQPVSVVCCLL